MAVTPTPAFTPLPPPGQRLTDSRLAFVEKEDAWTAAMPTAGSQISAIGQAAEANATAAEAAATTAEAAKAAAVAVTTLVREISTSLSIGAGAKNLTGLNAPSAATFANGDEVYLIRRGDRSVRMWGAVSSANMGAGTMTVTVASGAFYGSGTHTDWIVMHSAYVDVESRPPVALAYGATVTPDFAFENHVLTATGNFNLATPTNLHAGKNGLITIKQDATGGRTWTPSSAYTFPGSTPALSTAANAVDVLAYYVEDATTPILRCVLSKAFSA